MSSHGTPLMPPRRPGRVPWGCAAVLLPHHADGAVDWTSFRSLLVRTVDAGLTPAVNMDTGFVQLLDPATRAVALATAAEVLAGRADGPTGGSTRLLAGAFVADRPGDPFDLDRYRPELAAVQAAGGTPVVFPSHGLNGLDPDAWVEAHRAIATEVDRFVAFELGEQFVPYGRIYPLAAYRGLLEVPACIGAKHSSLSRADEWERLALRDAVRPDFHVLTGNDLAIDMVCWGSDYLLGLAAFAPDHFARRDAAWAAGDPAFHELNDRLQYLGGVLVPRPRPRLPPRRRAVPPPSGLDRLTGGPRGRRHQAGVRPRRPGPHRRRPRGELVIAPAEDTTKVKGRVVDIVQMKPLETPAGLRPRTEQLGIELSLEDEIEVGGPLAHEHRDLAVVGSRYSYLRDDLAHVAQAVVRRSDAASMGLGRMALSYPTIPADVLDRRPLDRRSMCRTISDCTTAPRHGMVSGCHPLDDEGRPRAERVELAAIERRARTRISPP